MFRRNFDYISPKPLPLKGKTICNTLGYRSVKDQIEAFTIAGARLDAFRAGYFDDDFIGRGEDIMDIDLPPGREPYSDFADVQQAINTFSDKVESQTREAHAKRRAQIASDNAELDRLRKEANDIVREAPRTKPKVYNKGINPDGSIPETPPPSQGE